MQCSALLGYSQSLVTGCSERLCNSIFCCRILVGVSNGIVSTSIFTVEICSPELRGTFSMLESVLRCELQESAGVCRTAAANCHHCRCAGSLLVLSLGTQLRWWQISCLCPLVPLLALLLSLCPLVPESPVFRSKSS